MPRYDAYAHFSAMLDRAGADWWLCMFDFETYWDSSDPTPADEDLPAFPMTVAAVYLSSKEQWDEFNRNWKCALEKEGLPFFHMTDFMAHPERGVKPYCEWDKPKRDRFYYKLANIINTRMRCGYVIGIPSDTFALHAPQSVKEDLGKHPYTFAVRNLLDLVRRWYGKYGNRGAVQYVFDRMGKGKGEILEIFDFLKEKGEFADELGFRPDEPDGISFQNKECFRPIQAADILAWNMRYFMQREMARGFPEHPLPCHPYFQFLRRPGVGIGFYRDSQMKKAATDLAEYEQREGKPGYLLTRGQQKRRRKRESQK